MKKKILFIDRDGTLIHEPPDTFQVDSFDKLFFLSGVITFLRKICDEMDFGLVMVTNQDGLGTESYPEESFWPVQNFIMQTFQTEGISFEEVCIDRSFPEENLPTRKPGTGMLTKYMQPFFDLENSYVIGDRIMDVKFAQNLGTKCIFIRNYDKTDGWEDKITKIVQDWEGIYNFL
ncbi:MAG TPA: histidinol-phosphatase, partial [Bacteroidia bacterium]|nr:histidinol-phosphatase [Bacteroidia bacterium]